MARRSVLLLGPRQTGKSSLLQALFPQNPTVDLLRADIFRQFAARPETLRDLAQEALRAPEVGLVIVDEVQKLPELFDEVQSITDRDKSIRFLLTGSSARKLKRGKANLLGGRLWNRSLHPLTLREAGVHRLSDLIVRGGLPRILDSPDYRRDLDAYIGNYLQEEILAEGLSRSLPQYARFLEAVALMNASQVDYTRVGNDAQIKPRTVRDHFQVLQDTLLGHTLAPYSKTKKRKAVATGKFYLFDAGVTNGLLRRWEIGPKTPEFGAAVEQIVFLELRAAIDVLNPGLELHYWRSQNQQEVDFVWGGKHAIEVKAKPALVPADLAGLRALKEEKLLQSYTCVCLEPVRRRTEDGILILPLADFVTRLWETGTTDLELE